MNTCRKPLTPYEASRARERRAKVLAEDAKKRRAQAPGKPRGTKRDAVSSSNLDEEKPTDRATRKAAAISTGYSGTTLDKVDKIRDIAEKGVVKQGKTEVAAPASVVAFLQVTAWARRCAHGLSWVGWLWSRVVCGGLEAHSLRSPRVRVRTDARTPALTTQPAPTRCELHK